MVELGNREVYPPPCVHALDTSQTVGKLCFSSLISNVSAVVFLGGRGGDKTGNQHVEELFPPQKHSYLLWSFYQEKPCWTGPPTLGL